MPRLLLVALAFVALVPAGARAQSAVLKAEAERVALIQKLKPPVVGIFVGSGSKASAGTGVIISDDGYAVTNFHVMAGGGEIQGTVKCGLPDGNLYDAVLVGLDKVGDIGLIKLLPLKAGQKFPAAVMGDSDTVREGDWTLAMGNPQRLATDFMPTVTFGMVSGVHRYQYPSGVFIEYADCIQIDTSINPGSSGGPLFNMKGELVGINGRGSVVQEKRGVMNSGVGYALSINQVKNFLGHLKAGLDSDHATLGALIATQAEETGLGKMVVTSILEESDAFRRGLDIDDELVSFAGRHVTSVNQFKNILGLFPRGTRVPLEFRREKEGKREVLVRLMGVQRKALDASGKPGAPPKQKPPVASGPGAKFFEHRPGFANYYFNRLERDRLLAEFKKHGEFSAATGWTMDGDVRLLKARTGDAFKVEVGEEKATGGGKAVVKLKIGDFPHRIDPLGTDTKIDELRLPNPSGGFMSALYVYHLLLTQGEKAFPAECDHGGFEPFYPPPPDGKLPSSLGSLKVDCEVLNTRLGNFQTKWFFSRADQKLLGFELRLEGPNEDPCEVYLYDYRPVQGRLLPHKMSVYYQDKHYGTFTVTSHQMAGL